MRRDSTPLDVLLARLAARQRGAVSYAQLRALGFSQRQIALRLSRGRLHRVHTGVYLVGYATPHPLALETAALLASGEGALLSHQSAALLWRLTTTTPEVIHVTVAGRNPGRRPTIRAHVVDALHAGDRCRHQRLDVTSPARTLVDLAAVVTAPVLEACFDEALRLRRTTATAVDRTLVRSPGRRGSVALRALLVDAGRAPSLTRSEAERRLRRLVLQAGVCPPRTNVQLLGFEVDMLWPDARLVVEVDGYAFHGDRKAFERDRRRDARLLAAGYRVMRVTWRRLDREPDQVVDEVRRASQTV